MVTTESGKSNLLLALEAIFQSKESAPGISVDHEGKGDLKPRRSTPFWQGEIPDFGENFYMGGDSPITFKVFLRVAPSFLAGLMRRTYWRRSKRAGTTSA